jgi:kynurenine formamidase
MAQRVIDLSLLLEDNMPAHKLFQRPVFTVHLSHESTKTAGLGIPGDPMTFQTNLISMLDHVGTHVDAYLHTNPKGASVSDMPLETFMGKAVCFDLQHIPDLGDITAADMEEAEKKSGVKVELLGKGEFQFFGVPLKFKGGSGSPVRAFAIVNG